MDNEIQYKITAVNDTKKAFDDVGKGAKSTGNQLNKSFTDAFKKLDNQLGGFGQKFISVFKSMNPVVIAITAAIVTATAALVAFVSTINKLDAAKEAADKINMTTAAFLKWDYILKQNGSSMAENQAAFARLGTYALNYGKDSSIAAKQLKALGFEVKDVNGNFKSQEDLMSDLLKTLSKVDDKTQRAALAQPVLGKSYANLLPLINNINSANDGTAKQFDKIANVINAAAQSADNIKDKFAELRTKLELKLYEIFAPQIIRLENFLNSDFFKKLMSWGGNVVEFLGNALNDFINFVKAAADAFKVSMQAVKMAYQVIVFEILDIVNEANKKINQAYAIAQGENIDLLEEYKEKVLKNYEEIQKDRKRMLDEGIIDEQMYIDEMTKQRNFVLQETKKANDVIKKYSLFSPINLEKSKQAAQEAVDKFKELEAISQKSTMAWLNREKPTIPTAKPTGNGNVIVEDSGDQKLLLQAEYDFRTKMIDKTKEEIEVLKKKLALNTNEQEFFAQSIIDLNIYIKSLDTTISEAMTDFNSKYQQYSQSIMNGVMNIEGLAWDLHATKVEDSLKRESQAIEDWYMAQKDTLDRSRMSRRQYDIAIDNLDQQKYAKEKEQREKSEKAAKEAAKRNLAMQIIMALANGAAASMQMWADSSISSIYEKVGWQIGIAAETTAAVALLGSQMAQLAGGGIIGGNTPTGDKQVVRMNSGEMALNKSQQAELFAIANGKSGGSRVPQNIDMGDVIVQGNATQDQIDQIGSMKIKQVEELREMLEEMNFRGSLRPIIQNAR